MISYVDRIQWRIQAGLAPRHLIDVEFHPNDTFAIPSYRRLLLLKVEIINILTAFKETTKRHTKVFIHSMVTTKLELSILMLLY